MNKNTQLSPATPCDELRLRIADLAIELHHARNAAAAAKRTYYAALTRWLGDGERTPRLDPRNDACAAMIEFTKDKYRAHIAARRQVYNAQRRLDSACRKVVAGGAA